MFFSRAKHRDPTNINMGWHTKLYAHNNNKNTWTCSSPPVEIRTQYLKVSNFQSVTVIFGELLHISITLFVFGLSTLSRIDLFPMTLNCNLLLLLILTASSQFNSSQVNSILLLYWSSVFLCFNFKFKIWIWLIR